jgi:hypothetical protein
MDELFLVIGKLYYDLLRSQGIIDSLQKQLKKEIESCKESSSEVMKDWEDIDNEFERIYNL